ncbi:galactose-specific cell agglutination protein gsf2-like isoform X2 [Solanum pennellii]|uniref:Galactose-specific cell agglutination protein gsf2-like isoform X1 n=1 Tax=Solanum pennellii TaxID=28526 RepID=A0ABM1FMV0_SOLPN|nr:galactose-specific cell agglutination protein gsf2-like isoform X1 [Solanum pennellii]XP_015059146.1 galactose-specific cell agglutination protein gsf2-like isoform X2 [Solanum pennellii]
MSLNRTCNSSFWTKEEDKAFENALALFSGDSDKFLKIAAAVPGKSLQEIIDHYNVLVEDITDIESGKVPLPKYERMRSSSSRRRRSSGAGVERRKGVPWTEEEHRSFLQGLAKHGKGDWRGISRNFVFSRTPTQVASHAQKYYSRLNGNNAKRRNSIHDVSSVGAANITEPSQGQKSDELTGPCGGHSQWPIADYVTEAFETGMPSLPGPVTNCTTDAFEGPSAVNPEKFPLGASSGSDLNSSFPRVDEFLQSVEDLVILPAEGTSGVCHEVDSRTSPSLSMQPSVTGGTGMYTHPVSFPDVHEFLQGVENLITVPGEGPSGANRGINTRISPSLSLQSSVAGGTRMYSRSVTVPAEGTSGVRCGIDTRTSPSLSLQPSVAGGTRMYPHPVNVPAEGTSGVSHGVDTRTSPSLSLQPSVVGGTRMYPHPVNVSAEGISGASHGVDTRTSPILNLQPSVVGGTGIYTDPIIVPAEGTSGARRGVDTRTSPSLSLQPSVGGCTGMYTHPVTILAEITSGVRCGVDTRTSPSLGLQPSYTHAVNNVRYDLEELMTKQLVGASQVGPTINTASLPSPIADHIGVRGCTTSSSVARNDFASTMEAPGEGFSVDSMQMPSIPGHIGGGTYPCWEPSSKEDSIFDLEDLYTDHMFGFHK